MSKPLIAAPGLSFLCNLTVTVDDPHFLGTTSVGTRRIIRVNGGHFEGTQFNGIVVPGGDDWIIVRPDGTIVQDVRIMLRTEEEEIILLTYRGLRHGSIEVMQRLDRGEPVTPSEYYFRTSPIFETASPIWDWLNRTVAVASGQRLPGKVVYSIYTLD